MGLEIRALGALEIVRHGVSVQVTSHFQQVLLALLVARRGGIAPLATLIESMWAEGRPAAAERNVRVHVHRLRRLLGHQAIRYQPPGYALAVPEPGVDVYRFEALVQRGRAARAGGDEAGAAARLREAAALCRGPAFHGLEHLAELAVEAHRLEELRLVAVEDRLAAELALGEGAGLISELSALVATYPLRERFRAQLMTALYRAGRTAEALAAYRDGRQVLVAELGIEPNEECRALERAILTEDPSLVAPGRPEGTARAAVPQQLPPDQQVFIGRMDELRRLDALLPDEGSSPAQALAMWALEGVAGVGKTALATHWAHRVRHRFPDGQLFVDLQGYAPGTPLSPATVLARFLRALGVPADRVPDEVDEAAGLYRSVMANRAMLVVLDNAADPAQVRPLLPGSPRCAVVVTSRGSLSGLVARDGAHRLELDVLSPAESVALLAALLGPDLVGDRPEAVAELVQLCGLLPLALRIAAAHVAASGDLAGYLTRLRDTDRLAALALPGDPLSSVPAVFDLSYHRLGEPARRVFRLLGLAPGADITAEAVAAAADLAPDQTRALLGTLIDAHLARADRDGRHSCHDLLREYAAGRARAEEPPAQRRAALARLGDYYLAGATAANHRLDPQALRLPYAGGEPVANLPDQAAALAWLDAERANLAATARHAATSGQPRVAWQLADVLRPYLYRGLHLADGLAVAEAGRMAAEAAGDRLGQATARITLAGQRYAQNRCHLTIDHASRVLALSCDVGWMDGQGVACNLLGIAWDQLGRPAEAAGHLQQAHDLHQRSGWRAGQAVAALNLAAVLLGLGWLPEAAARLAEAAELNGAAGHISAQATSLVNLGTACHLLGDLDAATRHLDKAIALALPMGDRDNEGAARCALAGVYREVGRYREAVEAAGAAVRIARDTGYAELEAAGLRVLAEAAVDAGDDRDAVPRLRRAWELACRAGSRYTQIEVTASLAQAQLRAGALAPSAAWADRALTMAREVGYRLLEGQVLTTVAAVHLASGDLDQALRHGTVALDIHRETGHRLGRARTHVVLVRTLAAAGSASEATEHQQTAHALYEEIGVPAGRG